MRQKIVLSCLALVLLVSAVNAFPLSGSNGEASATIYGVIDNGDGIIYLDISSNHTLSDVTLVDSDDKFYHALSREAGLTYIGSGKGYLSARGLYTVTVPKNTEIKRVRITPHKYDPEQDRAHGYGDISEQEHPEYAGDPFSIEWTGVPEVKDASLDMKFYGIQNSRGSDYIRKTADLLKSWAMDIKVMNNGTQKRTISNDQFEVVDQFGFQYKGKEMATPIGLMPGESMRFTVTIDEVSPLSRPIYLEYMPSNLTMDISAWA